MLKKVYLPAIFLVIAGARIFMGNATWLTIASFLGALVWLVVAGKAASDERLAAESHAKETTPTPVAPRARAPEETAQLIESIAMIRRMQREASMPPPPLPTEEEILATSQPAINLHRSALPVPLDHPARSYLGGQPRLPPELSWPEVEGDERIPRPFLAQIDLADLPVVASSPLPRTGTLYFFADMNDDTPETSDCRVLYYPGNAADIPFRQPPESTRPYSRSSAVFGYGSEPWAWLPETSVWCRTSFRFPFEFTPFDSVRDYFIKEIAGSPPNRNTEVFDRLMAAEFTLRFGPRDVPPGNGREVFKSDRDEWPFAWVAIEYGARAVVRAVQSVSQQRAAADAQPEFQKISDAASKWIERAAHETPHARCNDDIRSAFLKEWRTLTADLDVLSKRLNVHGRNHVRDLRDVLIAACYTCASNDAADVIPDIYRNALERMNHASTNFRRYQMLGHGEKLQWAPVEYAQQVLLLQVLTDGTLGWEQDSGCSFQFWISPDALRRADFDSVEMTLESD